jgi:hypothetical protein
LLIALIAVGMLIWQKAFYSMMTDLTGVTDQIKSLGDSTSMYGVQLRDEAASEVTVKFFLNSMALIIYLLLVVSLLNNAIYNKINRIKSSARTWWRFLVVGTLWTAAATVIFFFWQRFLLMLTFNSFTESFFIRILDVIGLLIGFLILFYFTINYFTHLVTTGRIWHSFRLFARTAIRRFHKFLVPLLISIIVIAAANVVAYPFFFLKKMVFTIVTTVLMMLCFVWIRFYYTTIMQDAAKDAAHNSAGKAAKLAARLAARPAGKASRKKKKN